MKRILFVMALSAAVAAFGCGDSGTVGSGDGGVADAGATDDDGTGGGTCAPDCEGVQCGDDGCGGSCGSCVDGFTCADSQECVSDDCTGSCGIKTCGHDECGVSCGECAAGEICTADDQCEACTTTCGDAVCGDDGCGGSCGECAAGEACTDAGVCEACEPACGDWVCGDDGCGGSCGACADGEVCSGGACEACTPACGDAVCGDDGCGGSCGECAAGETCAAGGVCEADCVATCGDAVCGDDGCGGSCGECADGETCTAGGACEGDCVAACGDAVCGDDGCGGSCGECADGETCVAGSCSTTDASEGCVNDADMAILATEDLTTIATNAAIQCQLAGAEDMSACALEKVTDQTGLSAGCAVCYVEQILCAISACLEFCAPPNHTSEECGECRAIKCTPLFEPCSGIAPEACEPECSTGQECGDDGCGGTCGDGCDGTDTCEEGVCVADVCTPECTTGQECGADGCGGKCGVGCKGTDTCEDGVCVAEVCTPECTTGQECGADGCGGQCGAGCADGELCADGLCQEEAGGDGACLNASDLAILETADVGELAGSAAIECLFDPDVSGCVIAAVVGATGLSSDCAGCYAEQVVCAISSCLAQCAPPNEGSAACGVCVEENCSSLFPECSGLGGECEPSCSDGQECGDDGCGGTCGGGCGDGETCDGGLCFAEDAGACTNASDLAIIEDADLAAITTDVAVQCLFAADVAGCVLEGVVDATGVSADCAGCYVEQVLCAINSCLAQCAPPNQDSEACSTCTADNCDDLFAPCSGIGGEEPTQVEGCGQCAPNTSCGGATNPTWCTADDCGDVTFEGECLFDESVVQFCDGGLLNSIDCSLTDTVCIWSEASSFFDCQAAPPEDPLSCAGQCGGGSAETCYCDALCFDPQNNDCCSDICDTCAADFPTECAP